MGKAEPGLGGAQYRWVFYCFFRYFWRRGADRGNWVVGFSRKIGKANSFLAEIWALRDGLISCNQLNLNAVMVELDAKALVDALNNPFYVNYYFLAV